MKPLFLLLLLWCTAPLAAQPSPSAAEQGRWRARASRVTIYRDTYGVPHLHGKTDAGRDVRDGLRQIGGSVPRDGSRLHTLPWPPG
jgi:hypothetical protein